MSSSSTPATSARRPPRRSIPTSAASARSKEARRLAGKDTIVTVAGCVAQAEGAEIARREPGVDIVVGPQSYHSSGELIARAGPTAPPIVETGFPETDKFAALPERAPATRAYGFPHRAGGLRQVLHVLRGALHARRRIFARRCRRRGRGPPPGRARRARDHAARPERQRLSRAGARRRPWSLARPDRTACAHRGARAPALHDQPSARHEPTT